MEEDPTEGEVNNLQMTVMMTCSRLESTENSIITYEWAMMSEGCCPLFTRDIH